MTDVEAPVEVTEGDSPLILAMPHTGLFVPENIKARLNETGQALTDTDWHIDRLYSGLVPGATIVRALFHRYVIDANRDPAGQSLYPGQNTTGLCPLTDFDGKVIYSNGCEPDADETANRLKSFHAPYHLALETEIARLKKRFGIVVVYDCHSIRSHAPFLFDGILPDFNIGTNNSTTCSFEIETLVAQTCSSAHGFSSVLNGRFKGGWTTRHYGRPDLNIHAIQMELAQSAYLQSQAAPFAYDHGKAELLRVHLKSILTRLTNWAFENATSEASI